MFAGYCWFESLAVAFATAGINLRAPVAALEHTVRDARDRAAQRAAAEHVAALQAAGAARTSAENDEQAAQEEPRRPASRSSRAGFTWADKPAGHRRSRGIWLIFFRHN